MADIFINRSTDDYDGSGSVSTATGSILVTFSGTLGAARRVPTVSVYSRSDGADFVLTHQQGKFSRFKVELASGDEYYFTVTSIDNDASVDLAVAAL